MHSDLVHFPSSPALSPPSPYTSPLRATTTRKRRFQDSGSPGTPRHCHPPPMFHSGQNLRRSVHLTQLQRSSLHLEKRLIKQKIEEHKISLQALEEQLVDVENSIASTTHAVGSLHCYMDQVGVPIPDMAEHVAAPILFSEDGDSDSESQDGPGDDDDARGQSSAGVDAYWANECQHRPARRTSTGIVSGKIDLEARISTHGQPAAAAART
ncbi:hypothetical protein EDB84DRAFT_1582964 [Lactarius hengduanensis]|nr:hypothetical protein EDB84DRAFT_1582964 [Lactarius hengduanensis]